MWVFVRNICRYMCAFIDGIVFLLMSGFLLKDEGVRLKEKCVPLLSFAG